MMRWASTIEEFAACREILGHPEVWPHHSPVKLDQVPDLTGRVCCFEPDAAMYLFDRMNDEGTLWGVHSSVVPEHRARSHELTAKARNLLFHTFEQAQEIWTLIPEYNTPAKRLALACGMTPQFDRDGVWNDQPVTYYMVTRDVSTEMERKGI